MLVSQGDVIEFSSPKKMTHNSRLRFNSNSSPVGWYIGSVVLQFEELSVLKNDKRKRKLVWENTILIKARTLKQAYSKLVKQGKLHTSPYVSTDGIRARFKFKGVGFLLPIYEELEDLSEVIWTNHGSISESRVRKLVKPKLELLAKLRAN